MIDFLNNHSRWPHNYNFTLRDVLREYVIIGIFYESQYHTIATNYIIKYIAYIFNVDSMLLVLN